MSLEVLRFLIHLYMIEMEMIHDAPFIGFTAMSVLNALCSIRQEASIIYLYISAQSRQAWVS